ncbi:GTP-binding protein [Streptomyces acidiscabies]|uniref:ATP/GTP-binding protein n=1 Tax=Streptomyces acidiscabies TaxID=42234 RepID=A0ABU4MA29_9ACTN|nr:ATP/GTP-binding protein [Streptomyces acidiscabies]MDX3024943.1 ATP/GTP-binding protein [Streptomyces acidiscabies]
MDSALSRTNRPPVVYLPDTPHVRVKILVSGPMGVGKTTFTTTVSEIPTLHTDEVMTEAAAGVDDLSRPELRNKTTTTVATDFGRLTLEQAGIVMYLFGTPGQHRFRPLWDDLAEGALGALVLVDTERLQESFEAMDLIEERGVPYAVAVNCFPGSRTVDVGTLRTKLDLDPRTPLVLCDARDRNSTLDALIALATHLLTSAGDTPS